MQAIEPRLLQRSRIVRTHLVATSVVGTILSVTIVAQAWLIADIIADGFHGQGASPLFVRTLGMLLLVFLARAALSWLQQVSATRAAVGVKSQLRRELTEAVLDPRTASPPPQTSRTVALFGPGLDALDSYFAKYLPQLVLAVTVPLILGCAMAYADVLSAVVAAVTVPLAVVFMVLVGWLTKTKTDHRWHALQTLGNHFLDVLDGLVTLKIFGRRQDRGLKHVGDRHRRSSMAALKLAFLSSLVLELFATIAVAMVAVGVGLRVVDGSLDLKTALFVLLLAPEIFLPIRQVGAQYHDSAEGVSAAADAFDVLDTARKHDGTAAAPSLAHHEIDISDVQVRYPGRDVDALAPTSARIASGEFIALTGPSGSGKSTLLNVLLGFVRPDSGCVTVAGLPLEQIDIQAWRRQIAWVPQTVGMLAASIADNVRLGLDGATEADLRAALHDAGGAALHPDRLVSEGGQNVSAGERRRIGIARALLRIRVGQAQLLLLDEPTAGLDSATEEHVIDQLRATGATVLVVTHRDAVRARADREINLDMLVRA